MEIGLVEDLMLAPAQKAVKARKGTFLVKKVMGLETALEKVQWGSPIRRIRMAWLVVASIVLTNTCSLWSLLLHIILNRRYHDKIGNYAYSGCQDSTAPITNSSKSVVTQAGIILA